MTINHVYDVIIVGSGIAGLYSAYKILQMNPKIKLLILEKNHKKWMGGRMGNEPFQGTMVVNGAGVGRKKKDELLIQLLNELHLHYSEFPASHNYASTIHPDCNVKKMFDLLKKTYNDEEAEMKKEKKNNNERKTFKVFAKSVLGSTAYKHFLLCSGYTDYEEEDAHDVLYNYGFDDNYSDWIGLSISWKDLVNALYRKIGSHLFHFSSNVENILQNDDGIFILQTKEKKQFLCNHVILATTIQSIQQLIPGALQKHSLYQQIHGQPFLRLYGKFSKSSAEILANYITGQTIVPGPLQKIIPMDKKKGVYMIAYSDNNSARILQPYLKNTLENREFFERLLETSIGLPNHCLELLSIKDYYWQIGTHYYEPLHTSEYLNRKVFLKHAQHPIPGVLIVGEVVALHQGWVEGALESVDAVLNKKWINQL
uniref:Amine oxidase domain-containing protein n=1 Tax=viral metagenome TaxID=1070528 RepID=A0A6C0AZ18_9ZZZZ